MPSNENISLILECISEFYALMPLNNTILKPWPINRFDHERNCISLLFSGYLTKQSYLHSFFIRWKENLSLFDFPLRHTFFFIEIPWFLLSLNIICSFSILSHDPFLNYSCYCSLVILVQDELDTLEIQLPVNWKWPSKTMGETYTEKNIKQTAL